MREFAITAIGQDRPGIVAGFTEVLLTLGCNLADCSMSLLTAGCEIPRSRAAALAVPAIISARKASS